MIPLRKIVIYLVGRKFYLHGLSFLLLKLNGICLITTVCFNIQTSHGFENLCLFSSNRFGSESSDIFSVCLQLRVFTITQIPGLTSLPLEKDHEDKIFGRQDILYFFSGVFKDNKYCKIPKGRIGTSNASLKHIRLGIAFFATGPGWVLKCISF